MTFLYQCELELTLLTKEASSASLKIFGEMWLRFPNYDERRLPKQLHGCSDYGIPASTLPVCVYYLLLSFWSCVTGCHSSSLYPLFSPPTSIVRFLPYSPGACSAARHSPGELRSTRRLDLSSDGRSLHLRDTMRPSVRH